MQNKFIVACRRHPLRFTVIYYAIYSLLFSIAEKLCVGPDVHIIHSSLDDLIPFWKYAIVPYVLWFPYIGLTLLYFLYLGRKRDFWRTTLTLFFGIMGTVIFYLFFKTGLNLRPGYVEGKDIFARTIRFMWKADTPGNVCPSIHVLTSVGFACCWNSSASLKKHPYLKLAINILAFSICASTVLVKQHSIIDVTMGTIVGLACYFIANRIVAWNMAFDFTRTRRKVPVI